MLQYYAEESNGNEKTPTIISKKKMQSIFDKIIHKCIIIHNSLVGYVIIKSSFINSFIQEILLFHFVLTSRTLLICITEIC